MQHICGAFLPFIFMYGCTPVHYLVNMTFDCYNEDVSIILYFSSLPVHCCYRLHAKNKHRNIHIQVYDSRPSIKVSMNGTMKSLKLACTCMSGSYICPHYRLYSHISHLLFIFRCSSFLLCQSIQAPLISHQVSAQAWLPHIPH